MYFELKNDILADYGFEAEHPRKGTLSKEEPRCDTGLSIDISRIPKRKKFLTGAGKEDQRLHFSETYEGDLIMSAQMLSLFEKAGVNNLQKIEAIVESTKDKTVWEDYFIINIIGLVACVDFEKSVYQKTAWGTFDFDELAIIAEKAEGNLLFRLEEYPSIIIMHKSVGKMIMQNDPDEILKGWDVAVIVQ